MSSRPISGRSGLTLALVAGLFLQAGAAAAASFTVTPTRVELAGRNSSMLLTLKNESSEPLRFQITTAAWSQSERGEMQLEPTEDILFFPSLVSLQPGEAKKVRLAASTTATELEKSYRIFFEELPPLEAPDARSGAQVRILTKMGVPIFVAPQKAKVQASLAEPVLRDGKVSFAVNNEGNVRFSVLTVKVIGEDAAGKRLFEKEQTGWYVLGGAKRLFEQPVGRDECSGVKSLRVEILTDLPADSRFATLSSVAPASCD